MAAIVFAVVGQHRADPARLLLLGDDGRHYGYQAAGHTAPVTPGHDWLLDRDRDARPAHPSDGLDRPIATTLQQPRPIRRVRPNRPSLLRLFSARLRLAASLLAALIAVTALAPTSAHAPALAIAAVATEIRSAPSPSAPSIAHLTLGETVELTGSASPDYLEVAIPARQVEGWVELTALDAGGLTVATLHTDAALQTEPRSAAPTIAPIPTGVSILLTGGEVDGYLAAAYEGTAGWLPRDALTPNSHALNQSADRYIGRR